MTIDDICSHRIVTVDSAASLVEVATLMREHHVGALVVITAGAEGPRVSGVVTDRDLVLDALARGLDGAGVAVGELARQQEAAGDQSRREDKPVDPVTAIVQRMKPR